MTIFCYLHGFEHLINTEKLGHICAKCAGKISYEETGEWEVS